MQVQEEVQEVQKVEEVQDVHVHYVHVLHVCKCHSGVQEVQVVKEGGGALQDMLRAAGGSGENCRKRL